MNQALLWAATGTGFTFLMTMLGAAMVFFFRKTISENVQRVFLGFAAGVMIAASVWSLLIPAMEEAEASGIPGWLPAGGGLILGVLFLLLLDRLLPHLHLDAKQPEGVSAGWKRTTLLMFAVTLHNIPEGMAVGLSFALASQHAEMGYSAALALALGIGIQNFPEGAAIASPRRCFCRQELSIWQSFWYCGADFWHIGGIDCRRYSTIYAMAVIFCCRRYALCGGGRVDSRGAFGRTFSYWHFGRHCRVFIDDDIGCGSGIGKKVGIGFGIGFDSTDSTVSASNWRCVVSNHHHGGRRNRGIFGFFICLFFVG